MEQSPKMQRTVLLRRRKDPDGTENAISQKKMKPWLANYGRTSLRQDRPQGRTQGHDPAETSQKQPTDGAASQRLRGGRLPLRPIQTSLIKLSNGQCER